jgi:hypothetical protein
MPVSKAFDDKPAAVAGIAAMREDAGMGLINDVGKTASGRTFRPQRRGQVPFHRPARSGTYRPVTSGAGVCIASTNFVHRDQIEKALRRKSSHNGQRNGPRGAERNLQPEHLRRFGSALDSSRPDGPLRGGLPCPQHGIVRAMAAII